MEPLVEWVVACKHPMLTTCSRFGQDGQSRNAGRRHHASAGSRVIVGLFGAITVCWHAGC